MYKYLFGPVPSRRLGMSLGVDLVPVKVCSLDCVYCEAGKTTSLTTARKEYVPYDKVISELEHYFARNPDPDYFTFSGSGEPTLNSRLGDVLSYIKQAKPHIPVAVLTNGTLLHDPAVREELQLANLVLPSLDAATEETFNKINRPAARLGINEYIRGLVDFRKAFQGKMWLEVFILPGYNDDEHELAAIREAITRIRPDKVQLNSLDRPGTESKLKGMSREQLERIAVGWGLDNVEVISRAPSRKDIKAYRKDIESAILETIARRPCTRDDLAQILGMQSRDVKKYLEVLEAEAKIEPRPTGEGTFYGLKDREGGS